MTIVVENLTVKPFGADSPILNDVSFRAAQGQHTLVLGPSGAGKSTLLLALSGALQSLETTQIWGTIHSPAAGLLLQNAMDAAVGETVFRDAAFGAESAAIPRLQISQLVATALAQVAIAIEGQRPISQVSGGELQRVCLAGLLTLQPQVLLLDEPTSMLDDAAAGEVRTAVSDYLEISGATAIIAEHLFEPWLPIAKQILVLDQTGRLVDSGATEKVLSQQAERLAEWGLWLPGSHPRVLAERIEAANDQAQDSSSQEPRGKITALVGPSGAGKSTRIQARLSELLAAVPATQIGWVPQNAALALTGNTVLQNAPEEWLERVGLSAHAGQQPQQLSGGEQRRLALAAALKKQPRYLLLDEPTVGLDTKNWAIVAGQLVQARNAGAEVLLATHDAHLLPLVDEVIRVEPVKRLALSQAPHSVSPLAVVAVSMLLLVGSLTFTNLIGLGAALAFELAIYLGTALRLKRWGNPKVLLPVATGLGSIFLTNLWLSSQPDLARAAFDALRVAYFVLPSVLLVETIHASVFGDQLGQILRLPARPVVAAMVAIGRLERLQSSWRTLAIARSLQGLTYKSGPMSRIREAAAMTLALTLDAIRAAQTASVAMEARGFNNRDSAGRLIKRTWAVAAKWGRLDGWLTATAVASLLLGFTLGRL